jgi:hypothetical protein
LDAATELRFWAKVKKTENTDDCWEWQAGRTGPNSYGKFRYQGKVYDAHRFVYEMLNGPINDSKLFVCHKCNNRGCVNPNHLYLGTSKDNVADMWKAGNAYDLKNARKVRGSENGQTNLTEDFVIQLRDDYKAGRIKYAAARNKYGIAKTTFYRIVRRENWKHIL